MGPVKALTLFYTHYFDVYGRSRRFQYVWILFLHFCLMVLMAAGVYTLGSSGDVLDANGLKGVNAFGSLLISLYSLVWIASIIPWLTLCIRRFHDMNHTGWLVALFMGLWLIPPIGALGSVIQFFWLLLGSGTPGANSYGQDPRFLHRDVFD